MASFSEQVAAWNKKAAQKVDKDVRGITLALFSRVILDSPVGNPTLWKHPAPKGYVGGRFRGNWNVSINTPDATTTENKDKSGAVTIAKAKKNIGGAGTVTYMCNALPYAYRLEFSGWSS